MEKKFGDSAAYTIIKEALESKALTLLGPGSRANAVENAKADAEYLVTLLTHLQKEVSGS